LDVATESLNLEPERAIQKALDINPSVKAAAQALDIDDLGIQSANNGLLPQLTSPRLIPGPGRAEPIFPPVHLERGQLRIGPSPAALADALSQMFGLNNPTYAGTLRLTLPIRNRTASMNLANSLGPRRPTPSTCANVQQNTRLNVLNAISTVKGAIESLRLARVQDGLQQKNYEAEKLKYELGTDINQNVVIAPAGPGRGGFECGHGAGQFADQHSESPHADRRAAGPARNRREVGRSAAAPEGPGFDSRRRSAV